MSTQTSPPPPETSVFKTGFGKEVLTDHWITSRGKAMKSIFLIGAVILIGDFITMSAAGSMDMTTLGLVLIVPMMYLGLGFMAKTKPMAAMICAALLFAGILALTTITYGPASLFKGIIMKALLVYLFISGFNHARDAERARKQLQLFQ